MAAGLVQAQVTDAQLARYARLIYSRAGIKVAPEKKSLLSNRLRRRLRETGHDCYDKYYDYLQSLPADHDEWRAFWQEVTTHETYLFRDAAHWRWLEGTFLAGAATAAKRGERPRSLRIWSAASSTGDEAFTIATCIAATLPQLEQWKITILGTDLATSTIEQAHKAEFGARAMHGVPAAYRSKYFEPTADGKNWRPKELLRNWVSFREHNLLATPRETRFDVVFLKNVLIYFDAESKRKALTQVRTAIAPGGFLVTTAAEGVSELVAPMEKLQGWLFRQPVVTRTGETR